MIVYYTISLLIISIYLKEFMTMIFYLSDETITLLLSLSIILNLVLIGLLVFLLGVKIASYLKG